MSQFLEYLEMAVANIRANKMRSLLTMLGIIIGISSVILIMSVGNGAKNIITDEMADIGINQIAIYSYDDTNSYDITQEDIDALYDEVKGIRAISAGYGAEGSVVTQKGDFKANVNGKMPDYQYFSKNGMLKGRYLQKKSISRVSRLQSWVKKMRSGSSAPRILWEKNWMSHYMEKKWD